MIEEQTPLYNPFDNPSDRKKVDSTNYDKMIEGAYIDLSKPIEHPPVAIRVGTYQYGGQTYPIPFGSYGDISCIVGASKSRKTFFKSAIVSGYAGGDGNNFFPNVHGLDVEGKWIIDFDTEQSRYHAQRTFRRVEAMTGIKNNPKYVCFALREYTPPERIKFIEWVLYESEYKDNIGLVSIDGYADLVTDFNNIDQASDLANKLMKWSTEKQCHITGILHRNFGTQKPVGHVGSFVLKKAETVVFVDNFKEEGYTQVKCEYSRNLPFDDIYFIVNEYHLPVHIGDPPSKEPGKDDLPF